MTVLSSHRFVAGPGRRAGWTTARIISTAPAKEAAIDPAVLKLAAVMIVGAAAGLLDTTIVNVAIKTIADDLHASLTEVQWVMTGYLLSYGMVIPFTGWALARFGARVTWLFSLSLFLAGSVAAGAAWNIGSLIAFRVVQGTGGGMLIPVFTTVLVQTAGGKSLGKVMATASLPAVVVPILGPVAGGLIVANLDWRWIFYVNVPICAAGLPIAAPRAAPIGLCGFRWSFADLDRGVLTVKRTVLQLGGKLHEEATAKSKAGDRLVFLDHDTAELLREHRKVQIKAPMAAGPAWQDNDLRPSGPERVPAAGSQEADNRASPQLRWGGAGGVRTRDRRIMRTTASCTVGTTCTDGTDYGTGGARRTGISEAPVHEPVHGRRAHSANPVTVRNIAKSVQVYVRRERRRGLRLELRVECGAPDAPNMRGRQR